MIEQFNKVAQLWHPTDCGTLAACVSNDAWCIFIEADTQGGEDVEICLNAVQAKQLRDWLSSALPTSSPQKEDGR